MLLKPVTVHVHSIVLQVVLAKDLSGPCATSGLDNKMTVYSKEKMVFQNFLTKTTASNGDLYPVTTKHAHSCQISGNLDFDVQKEDGIAEAVAIGQLTLEF